MRVLWRNRKAQAFTLVELLVVIAIIAVLAALVLPALTRGKQRAQRIQCISNLKEIGTAFQIFSHDHHGSFPMQVSAAEGGSEELVEAGNSIPGTFYFSYKHLQTLANELVVPRVLVCPADLAREAALGFGALQNSNVSYFVGVYANYNLPDSVLAGDRNVTNSAGATASLVRGGYGLRWTREMHFFKGNVLFSDTHVEQMNNDQWDLPAGTVAGTVLFLPAVPPTTVTGPGSPGGPGPGNPTPPPMVQTIAPGGAPPANSTVLTGTKPPAGSLAAGNAPEPPAPAPSFGQGMSATAAPRHEGERSKPTIFETDARETNGVAARTGSQPAAAPAIDDEGQPPLLWLLGAARALVAKSSWWLLLLLAVLIATALYLYSRRKTRERRRR